MARDFEYYRGKVEIDKHNLDRCLSEQPALFLDIADEYALARSRADEKKDALKRADAERALSIREGSEKITEKTVEAKVLISKAHNRAYAEYIEAEREAERWLALKETFQQRGYVLKDMVGLFVAGYFQEASTSGGKAREVREELNHQRREKIADDRQRRVKL